MKRILLALCLVFVLGENSWAESLYFDGTTYESWTIDKDHVAGNVFLNFGNTGNSLRWDNATNSFIFSNWMDKNTIIGEEAGINLTNGAWNTFLGYNAGKFTTGLGSTSYEGSSNTFIGSSVGKDNTTGYSNTYVGSGVGRFGQTAFYNTAIGWAALRSNISGWRNTAIGKAAGFSGTDFTHNVFIGIDSGIYTTSDLNTLVGARTGWCNEEGEKNTYIGGDAGFNKDNLVFLPPSISCGQKGTGSRNVAIGYRSLYYTGGTGHNVSVGAESGQFNNGEDNVFIGYRAGQSITNGTGNVFIGSSVGSIPDYDDWCAEYSGCQDYSSDYQGQGFQEISNTLMIDNSYSPTNTPLIYGRFDTKIIKPFGNYVFRPLSTEPSYLEVGMVIYADQTLGATIGGGEGWYGYNDQGTTGWFKFSGTQY